MSKDYLQENAGNYPVYSSQTTNNGIFGFIRSYDYFGEYVTWTTDGANAGSVFYHNNEKFSITNVCGLLKITTNVLNTRYLFYILQRVARQYVNAGMGNPKLMSNVMATIQIPIPPIYEQQRIVAILDKFDRLVCDISEGLPAELNARRKQYEYYRDKLLTFKETTHGKASCN
jgi:type I restriction enzyme S subunit